MERVVGIGGVFFRSRDPEALRDWYAEHLAIPPAPFCGTVFVASEGDVTSGRRSPRIPSTSPTATST